MPSAEKKEICDFREEISNETIERKSMLKKLPFLLPKNFIEFFDFKKFEKPNNFKDAFQKFLKNINYFIGNYLLMIAFHLLVIW
jgi:hypothetical protein